MMDFKEFLNSNNHTNGTYVNLKLEEVCQTQLFNFVTSSLGIVNPIPKEEYHCTIIFSRKPCPDVANYFFLLPLSTYIKEWKLFDTKVGGKCLIGVLESREIEDMHHDIVKYYGATHDYPEYHPHITICYDYLTSCPTGDIPTEIPNFYLTFDTVEVKPLDLNFIPGTKGSKST